MGVIKRTVVAEHHSGTHVKYEIDLAQPGNEGYDGGVMGLDCLGYASVSLSVAGIGATGTSGIITLLQSNYKSGPGSAIDSSYTSPITENDTFESFSIPVYGRYLLLDMSSVTFGTEGRIEIDLVAKVAPTNK